ncbi:MAG: aminoacyl-tRNA hydrolase [Acidobacteria bacterium]|nr:MAG: aminoacyl-tRNA hydrolase [Acidobacteriota bacterium]REK06388.1 MAG: aminoacyl-tRNA hydrolase [Acidobacteriota bacterium]
MIPVNEEIQIGENEITERFVLSRGPGGQNVNKNATTVQLRFDLEGSTSLDDEVKERLRRLAPGRIDKQGRLMIRARRFRTLERNRRDARERLVALIRRAAERRKPRKRRRGESRKARERRLTEKHRHAEIKKLRSTPRLDD